MASFSSAVDHMRVCMHCQGLGSLKQTDASHIVRDVQCDHCGGEGLVYTGSGANPFEEQDKKAKASARKTLADGFVRRGDYKRAAEVYAEALRLDEANELARANRSLALLKASELPAAVAEATAVIDRTENEKLRLKCLLRRAMATDDRDVALADLAKVLGAQPGHPVALAERHKRLDEAVTIPPTDLEDCD